jgi:ABC-type dipeptide/oligopeptide/nickel transport system permease subunit
MASNPRGSMARISFSSESGVGTEARDLQGYVTAAESLGARRARILWRRVAPQLTGLGATTATLIVSGVIINEAVLSLLGLASSRSPPASAR